jgi:hypothetical protein
MTYKPNYIDQVFIEKRFKGKINPLPAVMLYLRTNGTYVFGFCDNQISEAGRYKTEGDSILLYDRYDAERSRTKSPVYIYCEKKNDILYLISSIPTNDTERFFHKLVMGKSLHQIIPVMKDHKWAHLGFLRGQDMALDSIVRYYKCRTIQEQDVWVDSVLASKN